MSAPARSHRNGGQKPDGESFVYDGRIPLAAAARQVTLFEPTP